MYVKKTKLGWSEKKSKESVPLSFSSWWGLEGNFAAWIQKILLLTFSIMKEKDRWFFKDPPRQKKNELINTVGKKSDYRRKIKEAKSVLGHRCQLSVCSSQKNF